jgi:hypothetical protein
MSRKSLADTPEAPPPPPPMHGHHLCSGWRVTSVPIMAGDQGNPTGGGDTVSSPPHIRDDGGFFLASLATGPRTTPAHLAVMVEGTPIVPGQKNPYAGGLYSSSEDKDDSPPLLDLPAVLEASTAAASMADMTAAVAPKDLDTVLDAVLELENRRNHIFDADMMALHGRNLQVDLTLSDMCGDIALIREDTNRITSESIALVELNSTCLAVESNASAFLQAMEDNAASFWLYVEKANKNLATIAGNHTHTFDEVWYLKPACPPAAQLLYDLGLKADDMATLPSGNVDEPLMMPCETSLLASVPLPPSMAQGTKTSKWYVPSQSQMLPLPPQETAFPWPIVAAAAPVRASVIPDTTIASEFNITKDDMAMVYMSPDPFFDAFEENLDLQKWSFDKHCTAGLFLVVHNGQVYLGGMTPGTPCAKVDRWRVNLRGAWLIKVGSTQIFTISDAQSAFWSLYETSAPSVMLLFSHPELRRDISNKGLPIVSLAPFLQQMHDQLNRRWDF